MSITPLTMAVLVVADDLQRYRNRALRGEGNRQPAPIIPVLSHPDGETDGETWKRTSREWLGFPFDLLLCDEEGDDEENQEWTGNAVDSLRLGWLRDRRDSPAPPSLENLWS